jgi:hypothetical protein
VSTRRHPAVDFLYRLVLASPFWLYGWHLLASAEDWSDVLQIVWGTLILLIPPAVILAFPLAGFVSQLARGKLHPGTGDVGPVPVYSVPKSYRARGEYRKAMDAYQELAASSRRN